MRQQVRVLNLFHNRYSLIGTTGRGRSNGIVLADTNNYIIIVIVRSYGPKLKRLKILSCSSARVQRTAYHLDAEYSNIASRPTSRFRGERLIERLRRVFVRALQAAYIYCHLRIRFGKSVRRVIIFTASTVMGCADRINRYRI